MEKKRQISCSTKPITTYLIQLSKKHADFQYLYITSINSAGL